MGTRRGSKGLEAQDLRSLERVWFYRTPYDQLALIKEVACHEQDITHGISSEDIHKLVKGAENTTNTMVEVEVSNHKGKLDVVVGPSHKMVASRVNV